MCSGESELVAVKYSGELNLPAALCSGESKLSGHYAAKSQINLYICCINPILHTVWLDSHALTLKNYTAKYYEVRKIWFFAYLTNFLSSIEENCSHVYIVFYCYSII